MPGHGRAHAFAARVIARRLTAEALGTAFLLAAVVGSGIMGERLAGGNVAIALLANTIATGAALVVLISIFGPISGAHFNPAVSLVFMMKRELGIALGLAYIAVQTVSAIAGVTIAHLMFELPVFEISTKLRDGPAQAFSEFVATFGLIATILGAVRFCPDRVAALAKEHQRRGGKRDPEDVLRWEARGPDQGQEPAHLPAGGRRLAPDDDRPVKLGRQRQHSLEGILGPRFDGPQAERPQGDGARQRQQAGEALQLGFERGAGKHPGTQPERQEGDDPGAPQASGLLFRSDAGLGGRGQRRHRPAHAEGRQDCEIVLGESLRQPQ